MQRVNYDQGLEKRRRSARIHDFLELWIGFVLCRAVPALALPPLLLWVWLGKVGVIGDARTLVVGGLSVPIAVLAAWFFVRCNRG
jgi:hypothetical protein